jgi:serine/threonine protein kinase
LKKARPVLLQAHSSGDRVERREGELTSCKSEKTLPTFVRNRDKQPDKAKSKELSRENFKIIKRLGEGRFGTVFLVREVHTHFLYALKVMNKKKIIEDNLLTQFIRELKIQTFLEHPNIIRCYGSFSDHESFYAVLELGCDGQLFDIIAEGNTLSEESTSFIVGSLLDATSMMHKHKILHRDIKPENVVLVHVPFDGVRET